MLRELPSDAQPSAVRPVGDDIVTPDLLGLRDDLSLAADLLAPEPDGEMIDYITAFLIGISRSIEDSTLQTAVRSLANARATNDATVGERVSHLRGLIDERLRESALV